MSYAPPYASNVPPPMYVAPINAFVPSAEIANIRDWLVWSIINLLIGWGLGGIIPLIFSILCRSNKRSNDVHSARTMSTLALVFNIIATIGGILGWVGFIIWIVIYVRLLKEITQS